MSVIQNIKGISEKFSFLYRFLVIIQNYFYNLFNPGYNQISNFTTSNRYPELFQLSSELYKNKKDIKILSYGCSTGEECFSLRDYFPDAFIFGVDINKKNLEKARKNNNSENTEFDYSNREIIQKHGPYDMILAMSVFCRWPASRYYQDLKRLYPFRKFENNIKLLNGVLKPGGLFLLTNSNYLFTDTECSGKYETLAVPVDIEADLVPKFNRKGKRIPWENYREFVYKKSKG